MEIFEANSANNDVYTVGPDCVLLYYSRDAIRNRELRRIYESILSPKEVETYRRLHLFADRERYLVARALVRCVLSRHLRVAPEELVFEYNRWGKPFVLRPPCFPRLFFNLSHTQGAVICAIAYDELGVDIEQVDHERPALRIARYTFTDNEVKELEALSHNAISEKFIDFWVLKEAYTKGRGMGLSLPLSSFEITLSEHSTPDIEVDPSVCDGHEWRFQLITLDPLHRVACAVRRTAPFRLITIPTTPFAPNKHLRSTRRCPGS